VESVVGGLAANRLANGARDKSSGSRGRSISRSRSRSRSVVDRLRSRSRSIFGRDRSQSRDRSRDRGRSASRGRGLKEVAALGGAAAIAKTIYDRVRSKSRGAVKRDASVSSDESYVPSRRQRYQPEAPSDDRAGGQDEYNRGRSAEQTAGDEDDASDRKRGSSVSTEDTDDLVDHYKKTRVKEFLTAALASVATIHAAHGVYSSMVASEARHKKVMEGEISPEQARKLKSKNVLQDVAAVGIAALSIKSAFSEWKEMTEMRKEKHEIDVRRRKRIKARERARDQRMIQPYAGGYGQGAPPAAPVGGGAAAGYYGGGGSGGPSAYADANPYQPQYSNIPPPPVGAPPPNRYD